MSPESLTRADLPEPAYLIIARTVWLEIKRREEHLALFILMGLYLVVAFGARLVGNTRPEAVALMLNMGLWLSSSLAAVLTLLTAGRLIPKEIENRTLYPLLAKPVSRNELLFGKLFATVIAGWVIFILFTLLTVMTWAATFPLPEQDLVMFFQGILLQMVAIVLVCTLTSALSMIFPPAVALIVGAFLYFGGTGFANLIKSVLGSHESVRRILDTGLLYLPDFSKLCVLQRFTDGAPALPWGEFLLLVVYGLVFSAFFLLASGWVFNRRSL